MVLVLRRECYRYGAPDRRKTLMPPHADQLLQERILKTAQKLWRTCGGERPDATRRCARSRHYYAYRLQTLPQQTGLTQSAG